MLSQLHIENVAVIEKVDILFGRGFNVLTGETGAGKSILIDAINMILGEKASRMLIRTGQTRAYVSAVFTDISDRVNGEIENFGVGRDEDGTLMIEREIFLDGRGQCRINARPSSLAVLRSIGKFLINIHGQHDSQNLLNPKTHIQYLDAFSSTKALTDDYKQVYDRFAAIRKQLRAIHIDEGEKARRMEVLAYQIGEIEAAKLTVGEKETLEDKYTSMSNAQAILNALSTAHRCLYAEEEKAATDKLAAAIAALGGARQYSKRVDALSERLEALSYELSECALEIAGILDEYEDDPAQLEQMEARLTEIDDLERKYGGDIPSVLAYLEKAKQELEEISLSDEKAAQLERQLKETGRDMKMRAERISARRKEFAIILEKEITEQLHFLNMPNAVFHIEFKTFEKVKYYANGCDVPEFLIAVNAGQEPKPLSKVASGGELSRVMLAIKSVVADADEIDTLIFDEIDTGISGRAAQKVGVKIKQLSRAGKQVICVTHLAQIAAMANLHFLIEKHEGDQSTSTDVSELDFEGKKRELARIIGGVKITELTLKNAEEMLEMADDL